MSKWVKAVGVMMFLIFILPGVAMAESSITNWDMKSDVSTDKTWTVVFNTEIIDVDYNVEEVYVSGSDGRIHNQSVSINGKEIVVEAPAEGYQPNQYYELHIGREILSESGYEAAQAVVMPFTTEKESVSFEAGEWERESIHNPATLNIDQVNGSSVSFVINASSGGNVGKMQGTAYFEGDKAVFRDDFGCVLTLKPGDENVVVETNYDCSMYGGMGVFFDGTYEAPIQSVVEEDSLFVDMGLFTSAENARFKQMTGDYYYNRFEESFQLTSDRENLDYFPATVKHGMVRGLAGFMEGIIMKGTDGELYAAMIGEQPEEILYFTTDESYRDYVPYTIDSWVNGLSGYHEVYIMGE